MHCVLLQYLCVLLHYGAQMVGDITSDVPWGKTRKTPAHLLQTRAGKIAVFRQIVLRCIRLYFRYCNVLNLCAVKRRGILYGILFGIGSCKHLEQKVWIAQEHRAGEIIIFVFFKTKLCKRIIEV